MEKKGVWLLVADMGYGHQRAAWPLWSLAKGNKPIVANDYPGIPSSDHFLWKEVRLFYETISRLKQLPVAGESLFSLFDRFQKIPAFYPKNQDVKAPSLQLKQVYGLMRKYAWGKHLIEMLKREPRPFLTTFPSLALMAEYWKYPAPIYLVVTDSDIARSAAPLNAAATRIHYFASTLRSFSRLASYGVPRNRIFLTGFPLKEDSFGKNENRLKKSLWRRLNLLDLQKTYRSRYRTHIAQYLRQESSFAGKTPLRITFVVGGAGAQADLAQEFSEGLYPLLRKSGAEFHVALGTHKELAGKFHRKKGIVTHVSSTLPEYFKSFNLLLEKTDVLITKPSEMVFYAALGIPLVLTPPVGSHEKENRVWIKGVGAAIDQMNPQFASQWMEDLLVAGDLAECAMQGFVELDRYGTSNIKNVLKNVLSRAKLSTT